MVSPLWKACSDGNLDHVAEMLKEATSVDIEIKGEFPPFDPLKLCARIKSRFCLSLTRFVTDHTGVTPLIEAVKNGHIEVVRALLDQGMYIPMVCI